MPVSGERTHEEKPYVRGGKRPNRRTHLEQHDCDYFANRAGHVRTPRTASSCIQSPEPKPHTPKLHILPWRKKTRRHPEVETMASALRDWVVL